MNTYYVLASAFHCSEALAVAADKMNTAINDLMAESKGTMRMGRARMTHTRPLTSDQWLRW